MSQPTVGAMAMVAAVAVLVVGAGAVPARAGASRPLHHLCRPPSPVVALIDTGVARIPGLTSSVDWRDSRSFVAGEGPADRNGHGTQMAAIIHRIAPGATLLDIKALDNQGDGSQSALASAIGFAVAHGARIVNLSASGAATAPRVRAAIAAAGSQGVLVVVAAGNDGADIDRYPSYPAADRLPDLLAVAATNSTGALISSSDYGRRDVTLAAPGLNISTISPSGAPTVTTGTSPAAAEVSGTAALALARDPALTVAELRRTVVGVGTRAQSLAGVTSSGRWIDPARITTSFRTTACTPGSPTVSVKSATPTRSR